jgi:hypothetical protein
MWWADFSTQTRNEDWTDNAEKRALPNKANEGREGSTAVAAYVDVPNKRISVANAGSRACTACEECGAVGCLLLGDAICDASVCLFNVMDHRLSVCLHHRSLVSSETRRLQVIRRAARMLLRHVSGGSVLALRQQTTSCGRLSSALEQQPTKLLQVFFVRVGRLSSVLQRQPTKLLQVCFVPTGRHSGCNV